MKNELFPSQKKKFEIFAYLKSLNLRSLFWEQVSNLKEKHKYLYNFPFEFFFQFEERIHQRNDFSESDIDRIQLIEDTQYATFEEIEKQFIDFETILYQNNPFSRGEFIRNKKFLQSIEKNVYTIDVILYCITRSHIRKSLQEIRIVDGNKKMFKKKKKAIEKQINDIIIQMNEININRRMVKSGIDSLCSEQQKLFSPKQLKIFNVPPQKVNYKLTEYNQLNDLIDQLNQMKDDLEKKYLEIL